MDIEESDDGDDGQRRGANQRGRATVYVKQLALFVEVMLLEGTPAVLSLGNSVRIMGHRKPHHPLSLFVTRSKCVEEEKYPRQM